MQVITDTEAVSTVESITDGEANSEPPASQSPSPPKRRFVPLGLALLSVAVLCALTVFVIRFKSSSEPC